MRSLTAKVFFLIEPRFPEEYNAMVKSVMKRTDDGGWLCTSCDKTSAHHYSMFNHVARYHVESPGFQCQHCPMVFRTPRAMYNHKWKRHKDKSARRKEKRL